MPQVLKQSLKNSILKAARSEFLNTDYSKASMRKIAKNAQVSLSNIYNYFENKDSLFEEVIKPTLLQLEKTLKELQDSPSKIQFDKSELYFDTIVNFLDENRENLKLLIFKSNDSKFENYLTNWAEQYSEIEYKALKSKAKAHSDLLKQLPSEFFIKNLCSFFFKAATDLIKEDRSKKELQKYITEIFSFVYQGWDYYTD